MATHDDFGDNVTEEAGFRACKDNILAFMHDVPRRDIR
jgi:hypothetical protein